MVFVALSTEEADEVTETAKGNEISLGRFRPIVKRLVSTLPSSRVTSFLARTFLSTLNFHGYEHLRRTLLKFHITA
jgi:hypothetical protein